MVHVLKQSCYCCCMLLALVACSSTPISPISGRPPAPSIVVGKASVSGQVVSSTDHAPIKKTTVYLAQVYWDPTHKKAAYALDLGRSPAVFTDQNGFFSFVGIDSHEYVIFIGDYYGENDIIREKNGDARVVTTEVGKVTDVGVLPVKPSVASKQ